MKHYTLNRLDSQVPAWAVYGKIRPHEDLQLRASFWGAFRFYS